MAYAEGENVVFMWNNGNINDKLLLHRDISIV